MSHFHRNHHNPHQSSPPQKVERFMEVRNNCTHFVTNWCILKLVQQKGDQMNAGES